MKQIFSIFLIAAVFTGCRLLNPSVMLKTPKGYKYDEYKDSVAGKEYKISTNDIVEMRVFSNDGFKLTDVTNTGTNNSYINFNQGVLPYYVDAFGYAKLPVIGNTLLKGLTINQAQQMLEEKYSLYYIRPYIIIRITSRRVIVFPGDVGRSQVIPLVNNNTTLIEGLAMAGGLSLVGKAYKIKLIRRWPDRSEVYHIDLSTIDGLKQGNIVLQTNDIIYVEPRLKISQGLMNELSPIVSILSSLILLYTVFSLKK